MSKIEVNQISSQCGSTLTIGQSGDTVTLACGASQTGFGRTGTVDWDTTAKTAGFTAVSGNGYFVNTTSGAITVTLPATPSAGDIVAIKDYANTADTNIITIARNGSNIDGAADDVIISNEGGSVTLVYVDATKGWLVTDAAQKSDLTVPAFITATGGTVTCCGDYKIHTFTGPGTFTVTCAGNIGGSNTVDYLVVAGGGAGGTNVGAGGGGGGFRMSCGLPVTATGYPITVGGGGTNPNADDTTKGGNGSNSVFSTITSTGGGGGGTYQPTSCASNGSGNPGGSGGGGVSANGRPVGAGTAGTGNTPPVSPPQGNDGGTGVAPSPGFGGGGGGGASAVGGTATASCAGVGGAGSPAVPIFGCAPQPFYQANVPGAGNTACGTFAGGGTGGVGSNGNPTAVGGIGGGGRGAKFPSTILAVAGTTNSGGGGGGGDSYPGGPGGGGAAAGGSGIVVIRYKYQ